jgi:3-oxoacyl-[acyl-carrier protein] reductase
MTAAARGVLITGAARGIGLVTAQRLTHDGFAVVGADVLPPEDRADFADFVEADLREDESVQAAVDRTVASCGRIDALVNNAAITPIGPFTEAPLDDLDAAYAVNVRALFAITQAAVRAMRAQGGGGAIVNLASVNAERGVRGTSVYSLTKGAVDALTRCLAVELAEDGIRCNSVAPAPTGTRRVRELLNEEQIAARESRIPVGRLGEPEDVANAIAFLLAPESAFLTGVTLPVDGGYLAYGS